MNWITISSPQQIGEIKEKSKTKPQVIFKHSTRCSISNMAKNRLDKSEQPSNVDFYFLDLLKYRNLSSMLSSEFDVQHESPQVLLIRDGRCIYDESHLGIKMEDILEQAV
ncbi:MAG TPA: bacillithiol system redox-active protein YtxJ [Chitinophagaceae bacterium]|nr:bacillithiol system redox-active protein YtxJ [Chitinophagaceae bacterium]